MNSVRMLHMHHRTLSGKSIVINVQSWEFVLSLIPSVAQNSSNKRTTVSDSLRFKKKNFFLFVFDSFSPFYGKEGIVPIAFLKSDCERIVQVTPNKRATVSNSLQSLFTKELP